MTVAAIIQPSQLCTTFIPNWSYRNIPIGLLFEKSRRRKKPATVGGNTIGSVNIPSMTAFRPLPALIILLAAKIPRKKQKNVATTPVLSEIHNGLQSKF